MTFRKINFEAAFFPVIYPILHGKTWNLTYVTINNEYCDYLMEMVIFTHLFLLLTKHSYRAIFINYKIDHISLFILFKQRCLRKSKHCNIFYFTQHCAHSHIEPSLVYLFNNAKLLV